MVFSSSIFLFAFLPLVLLFYFNPLNKASGSTKLFALCVAGMLGIMYFSPEDIPVSWILSGAVVLFGLYLCKDWINRIWNSTERSTRNLVLLIFSLAFYAWGEPKYILLLLFSILLNYGLGLLCEYNPPSGKNHDKTPLYLTVPGYAQCQIHENMIITIYGTVRGERTVSADDGEETRMDIFVEYGTYLVYK